MSTPTNPAAGGCPAVPPGIELAHWGLRALAFVIDYLPSAVLYFIGKAITGGDADEWSWLGSLLSLGWLLYMAYLTGSRGQSIGKRIIGIKVVREADGQVIGGGMGIARYFLHFLDTIPCIPLGYLWPLWDAKKQTFTDKIMRTLAIKV